MVMAAKLTRLTHKTVIQLHLVTGSCTIWSSRSRRPVRKLSDAPAYRNRLLSSMSVWIVRCAGWSFKWLYPSHKSRDSSVGIALGYGLDDRCSKVRFPAGAGNFSLHHCVQIDSEAHPASYPMGTRGFSPGGKAAGAWSRPLTSI
jgi:hypothetical protein